MYSTSDVKNLPQPGWLTALCFQLFSTYSLSFEGHKCKGEMSGCYFGGSLEKVAS